MGLWLTDIILTLLFGTLVNFNVFFLLLLLQGSAQRIICLHLTLPWRPPLSHQPSLHLSYTVRCFGCWSSLI